MTEQYCEPPFWKDIGVIFKHFSLEYKPWCKYHIWNFGVRLGIIALFLGMFGSILAGLNAFFISIIFAVITGIIIVLTTNEKKNIDNKRDKKDKKEEIKKWDSYHELPYVAEVDPGAYLAPMKEHFVNGGSSQGSVQPIGIQEYDGAPYSGPAFPEYMPPTSRNLFMNVLLDEIKYNPSRPSAAPVTNPDVKQAFDDYFRVQWFSDPTDVFGKNQSQRQFVTQPSTSVPNDRESYQNWLYKIPGKTCKEGGRYCLPSSDGSPVTWLNQDS
jgi:hypothetical protein